MPPVPLKIRLPPDNLVLLITNGAFTTFKKPRFNCDRSHARPAPGAAGTMLANEAVKLAPLKIWKLFPTASGAPLMLTRFNVPP